MMMNEKEPLYPANDFGHDETHTRKRPLDSAAFWLVAFSLYTNTNLFTSWNTFLQQSLARMTRLDTSDVETILRKIATIWRFKTWSTTIERDHHPTTDI